MIKYFFIIYILNIVLNGLMIKNQIKIKENFKNNQKMYQKSRLKNKINQIYDTSKIPAPGPIILTPDVTGD